jgi:hypothetical protein
LRLRGNAAPSGVITGTGFRELPRESEDLSAIPNNLFDDLVGGLQDHEFLSGNKGDDGIGGIFDVLDEIRIQNDRNTVESCDSDHVYSPMFHIGCSPENSRKLCPLITKMSEIPLRSDDKNSGAMAPSTHSADSIQLARSILDAWSAKDSRRLRSALRDAGDVRTCRSSAQAFESERRELVSSVGEQIQLDLCDGCRPLDTRALTLWMELLRNLVVGNS